jgi:hypothetical protein
MMQYTTIVMFFLALAVAAPAWGSTVQVTVVGDDGSPISGAEVNVAFLGYSGAEDRIVKATEDEGRYTATGTAALRINVAVEKDGYYRSYIERLSRKKDHDLPVVLRRKGNQRALHARKAFLYFPVNRTWLGYDLQVGDWVAPHGTGKVVDAEFRCDTEKTVFMDGKGRFEIRFPEGGGLHRVSTDAGYLPRSRMKMPHAAPGDGYEPILKRAEESFRNRNAEADIGYFFRSRVFLDPEGRVVSAHYGKILEDIRFSPRESGWHVSHRKMPKHFATVWFTYYFNPTPNDRNLEFDPEQNLFDSLEPNERVSDP